MAWIQIFSPHSAHTQHDEIVSRMLAAAMHLAGPLRMKQDRIRFHCGTQLDSEKKQLNMQKCEGGEEHSLQAAEIESARRSALRQKRAGQ